MHVHGTGKVRRRDSRYTESHTAAAVWLFLPIWEGEELFKQVISSVSRFHLSKENDYEMPILQQS